MLITRIIKAVINSGYYPFTAVAQFRFPRTTTVNISDFVRFVKFFLYRKNAKKSLNKEREQGSGAGEQGAWYVN